MKKANELKIGSLLTYVNIFISFIIPLFYTPLMLRMLGQAEYGLYSLSSSVIGYLSLLTFGMGSAVVQYITKSRVERNKERIKAILGMFILIYTILAMLVCIVGFILMIYSDSFFGIGLTTDELSQLKILMGIMTLSTAISFPASVFSSVVIAYEKYIFRKIFECVTTILVPVLNLIVLLAGYATIGMAAIGLGTQVFTLLIFALYCKKKLNIYPSFYNMPVYMLKEIWCFSAIVFVSSLIDMLYWATDKVLIGGMLGTVAVAIYNIGGTFTTILQNLASAIGGVFGTRVTAMVFEKRPIAEISELLIRIGRIQYFIVSLVLSGFVVFGPDFLCFWAGEKYEQAYWIALLTMFPLMVPSIQSIAYATIVAMNKHKFRAYVYAGVAVINLIATILTIPHCGIIGAAACTGIAYILGNGIILNRYYYKVIGLDIPGFWKNIIKMSIIPIVLVIVSIHIIKNYIQINSINIFIVGVISYTIVFVLLMWIFTMNKYEKKLVIDLLKKFLKHK